MRTYPAKGKRTNSLAFAQADCHTCAVAGDQCDRRRPKCSTCLSRGRNCGGFATQLSWDSRRMLSFHQSPSEYQITGETSGLQEKVLQSPKARATSVPSVQAAAPLQFRFMGNSARQKKRRRGPSAQSINVAPSDSVIPDESLLPLSEGENGGIISGGGETDEIGGLGRCQYHQVSIKIPLKTPPF